MTCKRKSKYRIGKTYSPIGQIETKVYTLSNPHKNIVNLSRIDSKGIHRIWNSGIVVQDINNITDNEFSRIGGYLTFREVIR